MSTRHLSRSQQRPGQLACAIDDDAHVAVRNAVVTAHTQIVEKRARKACWKHAYAGSKAGTKARFEARIDDYINTAFEAALRAFQHWDPELAAFGTFARSVIQGALYALIGRDFCVVRGGVADASWDTPIRGSDDADPDAPKTLADAVGCLPDGGHYRPGRGVGNHVEDAMMARLDDKLNATHVRTTIRAMPPGSNRDTLIWRLLSGLTHAEIADRLGVAVVTARKRCSRALAYYKSAMCGHTRTGVLKMGRRSVRIRYHDHDRAVEAMRAIANAVAQSDGIDSLPIYRKEAIEA
jgi:RNA polymerase sigma factor (sigma-70 family)